MMRSLYAILLILVMSFLTSCSDSEPVSPGVTEQNPFNNGTSERNLVVVMSDFHLGADLAYSEINKNLANLEIFLEKLRVSPNIKELVLAGDILDQWFIPATVNTYLGKSQQDFVRRIAETNKGVVDALNRIILEEKIKVIYVPGNHDLGITSDNISYIFPRIIQARDAQGLGSYSPDGLSELVIEHGHRYNFFCAPDPLSNKDIAPGSILPPGYFLTRIATLHVVQNCKLARDSVKEISQNQSGSESQKLAFVYWNGWKTVIKLLPIENSFNEKIIVTNVDGFIENYSVNDIIPQQEQPGGLIEMNLFKNIQDSWKERQLINKVPIDIPTEYAIVNAGNNKATEDQVQIQYFNNPASNKRVVIFGHTHDPKIFSSLNYKGEKTIYSNCGTWIDQNPFGKVMTFTLIAPQKAASTSQTYVKLYNFEGAAFSLMSADSLKL